jgi:anaerobic magnesium-protoporphyrin IX monomethyl ester cyclase
MKITLIHPPFDDPTIPYHSTAYLRGHLAHNGFTEVTTRDLNIEFVNYCLEEHYARELRNEIERRFQKLASKTGLKFEEQEEFYGLWVAINCGDSPLRNAAAALRAPETFFQFDTYRESIGQLEKYFQSLAALCYPADMLAFKLKNQGRYSIYNLHDLFNVDLCRRICYPLEKFFFDRCISDPGLLASECIGISIVYDYQLLSALHLARLIKNSWPDKLVLLGGTSISQCYKYLRDKLLLKHFFDVCDGIVVGEGETAICEIASRGGLTKPQDIPNLITYDRHADMMHLPKTIHYEDLTALGTPIYQYPWDLYLSPERGINYSPTRGCYWNRCKFCDYGLNMDKPTSPWRERPVEMVVEDLKKITQKESIKYVYFAVDVMAPGYVERLSDAVDEARLDIRWSAEVRMEKIFSKNRCRKMAKSGCVSVSFGMESGNQRILDLIDKGTKVAFMGETMENFAEAGIAVQLMAFSHFPTETGAERKETVSFVGRHSDHWSTGGIGEFVLTGTAAVAKNPEKFGITLIPSQDADIVRSLGYQLNEEGKRQMLSAEEGEDSFENTNGLFPSILRRPWAGSTDSLHTMIYYSRYGRTFFRENCPPQAQETRTDPAITNATDFPGPVIVQGQLAESDFDIINIFHLRAQLREHIAQLRQSAAEPTFSQFKKWQQNVPALARSEKRLYWIIRNGTCLQIAEPVHSMLAHAAATQCSLAELLDCFDPSARKQLVEHLQLLYDKGYIRIHRAAENRIPRSEQRHFHECANRLQFR